MAGVAVHPGGATEALARAVAHVCARGEGVEPVFQPIVDLQRGVVAGFEALARFRAGPGTPPATPDRWFAAARRLGVGGRLEALALAASLAARPGLPPNCFLSLNVAPPSLFDPAVRAVLHGAGDLRGVVLEITEQEPVEDYDALRAVLDGLRERGAMLAIDDAGAGFASLRHVTALRPDFVKVDRELVAGVDADETKSAVVEALGLFASRLDAWIVAEGVETSRERERLVGLEVPLAQGFGLGRPGPLPDGASLALAALAPAPPPDAHPLTRLLETVPTFRVGEGVASPLPGEPLVVVDEFDRPAFVLAPGGAGAVPALCATPDTALPELARRAMTRPAEHRFAPVAVCDETGRLLGVVQAHRLLHALADAVDAASGR